MGLIDLARMFGRSEDEVAKRSGIGKDGVAVLVSRLKSAGTDRIAFDEVFAEIESNAQVKAGELAEIATEYCLRKVSSRSGALESIRKRFIELRRQSNKDKIAEKARPW